MRLRLGSRGAVGVFGAVLIALGSLVVWSGTRTPTFADEVPPDGPVRVISLNACGANAEHCLDGTRVTRSEWTGRMVREIYAWDADVVMLQEVCHGQWDRLRTALSGYHAVYAATTRSSRCGAEWGNAEDGVGLAMFLRGFGFTEYAVPLALLPSSLDREPRSLLCARGPVDGRPVMACNARLASSMAQNGTGQVLDWLAEHAAGLPVILGGDFDAGPSYGAMDRVYRSGLTEVDENDRDFFTDECRGDGRAECRSGEETVVSGAATGAPAWKKFDYVFFSAGDFHAVRGDVVDAGLSGHGLVRGAARFR